MNPLTDLLTFLVGSKSIQAFLTVAFTLVAIFQVVTTGEVGEFVGLSVGTLLGYYFGQVNGQTERDMQDIARKVRGED